ncbi:hypothetical protein ACUWCN_04345 [Klebsiella pneumoniae]|uniref:hypothetical protein n=1 Tax=Klebsiella pneumoniae TaxID=573 RepID=UPI002ABC0101|nr:hypothetical protein [Klebsiella pneumoniae]MDZ2679269.1 hypothetical protein [Klebsiella pneumoniae]MDZ2801165.1 hypothetical protein [Klebsiella pneumoniae]
MSVNVKAATLTNLVKYKTDRASLRSVRDDMKKLQKYFSKTEGTIAKAKMQAQKQAYTAQMQQQRQVQQQQKQAAKQAAVDAKAKANEQKKLAAAQARALKIQQQQSKKIATQQENADLARKRAAFQLGRLQNMSGADRYAAIKQANALVDAYARGNQSLKSMNQALSQHLSTQRSIARNNAKQAKQSGKGKKSGSSSWLSRQASAFIPGEILGPTAAAYAAQQAYQIMAGTLAGAIERNQGRKMISSMGGNPLEADAARMETLKRTGFSMSYEKYSDISKDTQDKIGQLSLGQWTKDRQGKASFSGGGEMSDWLQIMVNRGGYSQEGALKTLQNIKGPVELAVLLKSLQKSAKLTESEFTALAETINDFSYLAKSVDSNGQNVIDTMNMMINSGLALNSQQQKSIDNLSQMSIVFDNARNALGDQFAASFSKGLDDLGINTQNLSSEMGSLVPLVKDLGMGTAQTVKGFKDLLDVLSIVTEWKNRLLGEKPEERNIFQQGATFVGESLLPPGVLDMASRIKNIVSPGSDSSVASQVQNGGWYNQIMPATPSMQYQPVIPDLKADFNLTVNPSPEFGMMVEAVADKRIEWAFDDQNFQINQSILGQ